MKRLALFAALFATLLMAAGARAQTRPAVSVQAYPVKPIRFIVPVLAGGAGDIFVRTIAQKLAESMGQPVVVENRPGAATIIGTDTVAKAPPDGYTIGMVSAAFTVNPSIYAKLPFDPIRDFAPVTQGTYYGYVLVVNPSLPARSLADLIALARADPGKIAYGSSGTGGANHLAGEFLAMMTGTKLTHVPYKGSSAALADVLGGQLPTMFDTLVTSIPLLKAGRLRALGFSGSRRSAQLPDVPTLDELGVKGFEMSGWQGIAAPAGTPRPIVQRLYVETAKALKLPDVIERLGVQGGNELIGSTPEQLAALIKTEIAKYAKITKQANIRAE